MSSGSAPTSTPRVYAEALTTFLDGEAWGFTLTVKDPATGEPMNLTGSRLWTQFASSMGEPIGICDSAATNGSLIIPEGAGGQAAFLLPTAGRTWTVRRSSSGMDVYRARTAALGDLWRKVGSAPWQPICRIRIPVMPTTGVPPQS